MVLDRTDINLTVDSAHHLLGGMDPAENLLRWAGRINHVHVKDVFLDAVPPNTVAAAMDVDDWWGDLAAPLGEGDVDLEAFVAGISSTPTRSVVIEQDRDPVDRSRLDEVIEGEAANRRWLTARLDRQLAANNRRVGARRPHHPRSNT